MLNETDTGIHFSYSLRPKRCKLLELKQKEKINVKMIYEKCGICGGRVERWEEDPVGICIDCNSEHRFNIPFKQSDI